MENKCKCASLLEIFKQILHSIDCELGFGYSEAVYQNAIELELRMRGVHYVSQPILPVYYKGVQVGTHRPDLIVAESLIVELKTSPTHIRDRDTEQLQRYVKNLNDKYEGLLIHIGPNLTQMWTNKSSTVVPLSGNGDDDDTTIRIEDDDDV